MAPITTELRNELGHQSEPRAGARTQPVSIEIPVLVRGSRRVASVPGQPGKLEHFSEETTTVVVFAQGAVVRLVGSAKAGQLVGLTNRQTGKEALCRIVNIKHFPDTRGYVEIEFNHTMNGFWQTALSQEAPTAAVGPAVPKKDGSAPLDALGELDAAQLLRATPKELKDQLLEMAALLKSPANDVSDAPGAAPAMPPDVSKSSTTPQAHQSAERREPAASEQPLVEPAPAAESVQLTVESSGADVPLVGLAPVSEVADVQADGASPESEIEIGEIGVSEFEIVAAENRAHVRMEDASVVAETEPESAQSFPPAAELPVASISRSVATQPEVSSDSSPDIATFALDVPSAGGEDLDAELESLLQPLNELAEPAAEANSTEVRTLEAEASSAGETHSEALSAPLWEPSEEIERSAPPEENLDQDGLAPEDMWNAGSIVHSNLERPSAGSSDADMRASEEKTLENSRMAELKAALVTPSAAAAMREDGSTAGAARTGTPVQLLSLESVWNLFRGLNKSVIAEGSGGDAASYRLFTSGAIADVHRVDADAADDLASSAGREDAAANTAHAAEEDKADSAQPIHARGRASATDDSHGRSEDDEPEAGQESAANHRAQAARHQDEPDEQETEDAEADQESSHHAPRRAQSKPDVVPQWYSTTTPAAASKPWGTPGASPCSNAPLSAPPGTMATTTSRRSTGTNSILAYAAATLLFLAAGAAAFHTLRPSVSYLMKPPASPPAVDPDENAAARDAAVASLLVPPLPADIQARVANSAPVSTAKPTAIAPRSSRSVPVPGAGGTSTPLHVGDGVKAPRVLSKISPVVPEAVSASGISGDVILSVVVDNTGRVATARVLSGPAGLRAPALEAVRQWEYQPALENGRPVAVQIYITVNFPRP